MSGESRILHPLAPVYDRRSRVLILGTIPSPKSRENGFYYGHPQNRFWRVLAALFSVPVPETNEEKAALLLKNRVALFDVLRECSITGARDETIRDPAPNDLTPILEEAEIRGIFTTGTKAYNLYEKYIYPATGRKAVRLPSTSPANCACSLERLCEAYRVILPLLAED